MVHLSLKPLGDTGIRVQFGEAIDPRVNRLIRSFCWYLEQRPIRGISEWIPTYTTVTVLYRPDIIRYRELCRQLEEVLGQIEVVKLPPAQIISIPTIYGGEYGADLPFVAEINGLSEEDVIRIHSGRLYLIYMIGFAPGFPYLGGMSSRIAAPRLENPRPLVPAGSVGIAGAQTGIYSLATPGGWRIIGRTPLRLYDPGRTPPVLLRTGDYVKFVPIDEEEYRRIEERVAQGTYVPERRTYDGEEEDDGGTG